MIHLRLSAIVSSLLLCLLFQLRAEAASNDEFELNVPPRLSGRIVFSAQSGSTESIFVLDLDGRRVRKLIGDSHHNSYPSWSPDGTKLAFASDRDSDWEIYVSDFEGQDQLRLTNNPGIDDHPAFAHDRNQIIYFSESADGKGTNIYTIVPPSTEPVRLTNLGGKNSTPQLSPDGTQISYSTSRFWPGWDICLWDIKEQKETCPLKGEQSFCRAQWSNSGERLVYSFGFGNEIDLGILELKSGAKKSVTSMDGREYDASWSPSEDYLVFAAENGERDRFKLFILELSSGKISQLLSSRYSLRYPAWSAVTTMQLEARRMVQAQRGEAKKPALPEQ
ncbi:MAG: DPP IV N-terminal domain-containing protein [Oligoflexia bacterium]|nr:DPP IV N-terminal domain-containing protein [Oligoflexia bacterium]